MNDVSNLMALCNLGFMMTGKGQFYKDNVTLSVVSSLQFLNSI